MMFSSRHERIVDFVIAGTQKGGTSSLNIYLREHPEICMADRKEAHFFDNEDFFAKKKAPYREYHSLFRLRGTYKLIGEATPIYMYWQDAPRRIWEYNPNMKIIILLRNPIDRAYSHWNMERLRNADSLSFWEAIKNEPDRCRTALPYQHRVYSYTDRGFYLEQLRRIWRFFPKHQVLILKSEYLKYQPNEALREVCEFLEVGRVGNIEVKTVHSRPYASGMSDREKKYLRLIFQYEIRNIERVLGWDCEDWLAD